MYRSQFTIIFDMLKVMENRPIRTPLKILFERARIRSPYQQQKYIEILEKSDLVTLTGHAPTDLCDITNRGEQYIIFYNAIEGLLRSGFHAKKENLQRAS